MFITELLYLGSFLIPKHIGVSILTEEGNEISLVPVPIKLVEYDNATNETIETDTPSDNIISEENFEKEKTCILFIFYFLSG